MWSTVGLTQLSSTAPEQQMAFIMTGSSFMLFKTDSLSYRLNSAIIDTPITLFNTNFRYTHTSTPSSRGRGKDSISTALSNQLPCRRQL